MIAKRELLILIYFDMHMEQEKTLSNKIWPLVAIVATAVAAYFIYQSINGESKYKISFPFTQSVVSSTTFACEALIDSGITGSPAEDLTNGIEAIIGKGTNKVSLEIKDEKTLSFLSGASFNAGEVGGDIFTILNNDDRELVAAMWNGMSMNTIVLHKKNGLAIWSKSRSDFPTYDAPSAELSYLICR